MQKPKSPDRGGFRVLFRIPDFGRGKFPILDGENSRSKHDRNAAGSCQGGTHTTSHRNLYKMTGHRARGVATIPPVEIYSGLPPIEIQT